VAEQDGAAAGAERRRRDEGRSRAGARKADIALSMDWAETGARQLVGQGRGGEGSQNELLLGMDRGTLHKMFPREIAITTSSTRELAARSLAGAGHPFSDTKLSCRSQ
jgi:hypothetical protein